MRSKYKEINPKYKKYHSIKKDENIGKNESIKNINLKQPENLPYIQKNQSNPFKISDSSSNKNKFTINIKNNTTTINKNVLNNDFIKKNNNNNLIKEENKNIVEKKSREASLNQKFDDINNIKKDNITLKKYLDNIEEHLLIITNDINGLNQNYSKFEFSTKSKLIEISNNIKNIFNYNNDNIKTLNKKLEENRDISSNNRILSTNLENSLKAISSEIKFLKEIVDKDKKQSNFRDFSDLNEEKRNELIELKNENGLIKKELEKINLKFYDFENNNKELYIKIDELKKENEELKIKIKDDKNKYEELNKQNEEIRKLNIKLIKQNEDIIKKNKGFEYENKQLKKEIQIIKDENEKLIIQISEKLDQNEAMKGQKEKKNQNEGNIEAEKSKLKKYYGKKYALVGLYNIGNTCYMSSVLQLLKNIPQFTYNIFELNDNGDNFLIQLKNLFIKLCLPDNSVFSPEEFKKYLGLEKLGKMFAGKNQCDSSIFFVSLLNIIDKKFNNKIAKKVDLSKYLNKTLKEKQIIYKNNFYSELKISFIYDIFYIYYASELKCKKCNDVVYNFQKNNFLDFPIVTTNGSVKSLEECFDNYQKSKDVKDTCSKCKGLGMTYKCILLELPPVLIINLRRVGEQLTYYNEIEIPKKLDMKKIIKHSTSVSNSTYELRGFIKHNGDEKLGHNYAFCKNMFDDNWYEYNDDKCISVKGKLDFNRIFFLCYIKEDINEENIKYLDKIVKIVNNQK